MNRNRIIVLAALALAVLTLSAFGFNQTRRDTVPQGVSVAGIDVSGMTRLRAETELRRRLQDPLSRTVIVSLGNEERRLSARRAGVDVDVQGMVQEAIDRGNSGFFVATAVKNLVGSERGVDISPRISYSETAVARFIRGTRRQFNRPAKDASVEFSATGLGEVDGQTGIAVKSEMLERRIVSAFTTPGADREIRVPVKKLYPKVTREQLADKYPTAMTVDRSNFKLRLFKKLKLAKTYRIAVGQVGMDTPAGKYTINNKQVNPAWHVPNSDWAGKLKGKVIPPGDPRNPLKARWLGIYDGVGIHGTSAVNSIGSAASHGCIRMIPADVIELYDRVPVGTPIYIG